VGKEEPEIYKVGKEDFPENSIEVVIPEKED